jgi:N utilization substance protein B
VEGIVEQKAEIDNIIATHAPAWPIMQMAMVDRNLLRVAIYEMTVEDETPPKAAINEAVELAKIYGSNSSSRFVNGVLGSVMDAIEAQD